MSNRRFMLFFLTGIVVLGAAQWGLSWRARAVASADTRRVLCTLPASEVDTIELREDGTNVVRLVRQPSGDWRIVRPFGALADSAPVAQLLDVLTLQPIEDMRSEVDLAEMHENLADFGLARPRFEVSLARGERAACVGFGSTTASGTEVYARTEGLKNVFTLSTELFNALPRGVDAFRVRTVLGCARDEIAELDVRVPDRPAIRLVRRAEGWTVNLPVPGPADEMAVSAFADQLAAARVAAFELPTAARPAVSADGALAAGDLVPYGLAAGEGAFLTVRSSSGAAEQIVFGKPAGTNFVWALVRNGTAVVKLDAALAETCRGASFRDTRVFPLAEGEKVRSISLTAGDSVYVLAMNDEGVWRLEAPVVAPADPTAAAALAERVLRLRQDDLPPQDGARPDSVRVAVSTSVTNRSGVIVADSMIGKRAALADLRAKTLLVLDPGSVRRLSVRGRNAAETTVRLDVERATWLLERTGAPADGGRRVRPDGVKTLLAALTRVEATRVETVAATADDLRRCGLDDPELIVAVDVDAADAVRRNVLLGADAPGGGRYATVGGADAVFIVSKRTVADLSVPLTE